jgi:hypothetical protein
LIVEGGRGVVKFILKVFFTVEGIGGVEFNLFIFHMTFGRGRGGGGVSLNNIILAKIN